LLFKKKKKTQAISLVNGILCVDKTNIKRISALLEFSINLVNGNIKNCRDISLHSMQQHIFMQVKTIKVLVNGGYHAQVRLHLPPGLREDEEMTFPLILHV